jgi:cyclopropane fatty-acyl-phospholipid synthase-like methyltransferase
MDAHDWDAESYERVGAPVRAFGRALVERLDLRGDKTVLDAGCGSGEITRELAPGAERFSAGGARLMRQGCAG